MYTPQVSINSELAKAFVSCAQKEGLTLPALVRQALMDYVSTRGYEVVPSARVGGRPKLPGFVIKLFLHGTLENLLKIADDAKKSGLSYVSRKPDVFGRPEYGTGPSLITVRLTEEQIGLIVALKPRQLDPRTGAAYISRFASLNEYLAALDATEKAVQAAPLVRA